jgi:hypothetical protein
MTESPATGPLVVPRMHHATLLQMHDRPSFVRSDNRLSPVEN